jgi:hypothetical protein
MAFVTSGSAVPANDPPKFDDGKKIGGAENFLTKPASGTGDKKPETAQK